MVVRIQTESFDAAAEAQALSVGRTDIGAVVTFTRLCRGEEGIEAVILECYADVAEVEISRLVDVARAAVATRRSHGHSSLRPLLPGDPIVLVVIASAHRQAAFAAAEFLMDHLKTSAPFWKKEERTSGSVWVEAKAQGLRGRSDSAVGASGGLRLRHTLLGVNG
ncbi:MAG: molybdenum cofactor biosynthesis protein MoaE [Rhodopseudomonas palustris]|nr:molybdenum cofactor biosynthesis protein MoaE [Rhodopseudomonas palustris]